jgi:hypothetical protein
MITWKEQRLVPIIDTTRVVEGYDNPCETCENWGDKCESCGIFVPIRCDFEIKEVTMCQMTMCGIPIGTPYEVKEND